MVGRCKGRTGVNSSTSTVSCQKQNCQTGFRQRPRHGCQCSIAYVLITANLFLCLIWPPDRRIPSHVVKMAVVEQATWSLSQQEREATVDRIASNISTIAFFKGLEISDDAAKTAAVAAERKAYTAAQVAARTTTGHRPAAEITSGYARCVDAMSGSHLLGWRLLQPDGLQQYKWLECGWVYMQTAANSTVWLAAADYERRKLGELVLAAVTDGATSQQAPATAGGDSAGEVRNSPRLSINSCTVTASTSCEHHSISIPVVTVLYSCVARTLCYTLPQDSLSSLVSSYAKLLLMPPPVTLAAAIVETAVAAAAALLSVGPVWQP